MKFKIIIILLFSTFLFFPKFVKADAMPPNKKGLESYIKFEGWENVQDYFIVIPGKKAWSDCGSGKMEGEKRPYSDGLYYGDRGGKTFYLINSGYSNQFGFDSHSSTYFDIVAIPKKNYSEISKVGYEFIDEGREEYYINCDSDAYKMAIKATREIPHGDPVIDGSVYVDENDPRFRVDYIVTFLGVSDGKLKLKISSPIERKTGNEKEAQEFIDSDDYKQVLEYNPNSAENSEQDEDDSDDEEVVNNDSTDQENKIDELNEKIEKLNQTISELESKQKNTVMNDQLLIMGISGLILVFGIGFMVGKIANNKKVEIKNNIENKENVGEVERNL